MSKIIIILIIVAVIILLLRRGNENKQVALENRQIGFDYLITNKSLVDIITTDSGLQYQILTKGDGTVNPGPRDKVKVHYHGSLINGEVFDSSVDGQPISFGLNQVIKGWTEGVQLMAVGDKFKFYIPSELAYGDRSAGKIPAGSTLIFEVELLAIN